MTEGLLLATGGYGVSRVAVQAGSPVIDRTLVESGLRRYDVMVLVIVREGVAVPNPTADTKILRGDELILW
jgi:ribosomal protein S6--L-glutamate ligase